MKKKEVNELLDRLDDVVEDKDVQEFLKERQLSKRYQQVLSKVSGKTDYDIEPNLL